MQMKPFIMGAVLAGGAFGLAKAIDDIFYTTKDLSDILDVTEYTVRKKIRDGEIQAETIPGQAGYRVSKSNLDKYLKKNPHKNISYSSDTNFLDWLENLKNDTAHTAENLELLNDAIEIRENALNSAKFRLQRHELEDNNSTDFQKEELDLKIKISDLELEIKTFKTAKKYLEKLNAAK